MIRPTPGNKLTVAQRQQVLAAFVHRWTFENARQSYKGQCPGRVQQRQCGGAMVVQGTPLHLYHRPLVSDEQWLAEHAFYVTKDGRLAARPSRCEPVLLAS